MLSHHCPLLMADGDGGGRGATRGVLLGNLSSGCSGSVSAHVKHIRILCSSLRTRQVGLGPPRSLPSAPPQGQHPAAAECGLSSHQGKQKPRAPCAFQPACTHGSLTERHKVTEFTSFFPSGFIICAILNAAGHLDAWRSLSPSEVVFVNAALSRQTQEAFAGCPISTFQSS